MSVNMILYVFWKILSLAITPIGYAIASLRLQNGKKAKNKRRKLRKNKKINRKKKSLYALHYAFHHHLPILVHFQISILRIIYKALFFGLNQAGTGFSFAIFVTILFLPFVLFVILMSVADTRAPAMVNVVNVLDVAARLMDEVAGKVVRRLE
jgi:hypothetical protein